MKHVLKLQQKCLEGVIQKRKMLHEIDFEYNFATTEQKKTKKDEN